MNKEKIFQALKQAYAQLGLGDTILQAHAESLAAIGFVTDENLATVVAAQKQFLEGLQKANDKRVTDAIAKAKTDAKSEYEAEVARKKAEKEAKEREEQLRREKEKGMPDWYKLEKAAADKTMKELLDSMKVMKSGYDAMKTENDKFKAEKALSERKNSIISKAKELGIPQWRIDEGFVIADDADDNAITAHLATVSNNVKAQLLPGDRHSFPLSDDKPDKDVVKAIAKSMVK